MSRYRLQIGHDRTGPLTHALLQLWSVGLAAGFIVGTVAMLRPKFLKWHASAAVTIQMTFIAAAACSSPTHHGSVMACFFMSSFGIGYVIVVCYTSALLPARQRDLGLVVGLVAGFRNLSYSVGRKFGQFLPSTLFDGHPLTFFD